MWSVWRCVLFSPTVFPTFSTSPRDTQSPRSSPVVIVSEFLAHVQGSFSQAQAQWPAIRTTAATHDRGLVAVLRSSGDFSSKYVEVDEGIR